MSNSTTASTSGAETDGALPTQLKKKQAVVRLLKSFAGGDLMRTHDDSQRSTRLNGAVTLALVDRDYVVTHSESNLARHRGLRRASGQT